MRTLSICVPALVFLGLFGVGCGGDGSFSCDYPSPSSGSAHTCDDITLMDSPYSLDSQKKDCKDRGGTVLAGACPRQGTQLGCKTNSNGGTIVTVSWDYSNSASVIGSLCTSSGGTTVKP